MPSSPEILDINTQERFIEIHRCLNTQNITASNSHQTIPRKVKEQIESIQVHIFD